MDDEVVEIGKQKKLVVYLAKRLKIDERKIHSLVSVFDVNIAPADALPDQQSDPSKEEPLEPEVADVGTGKPPGQFRGVMTSCISQAMSSKRSSTMNVHLGSSAADSGNQPYGCNDQSLSDAAVRKRPVRNCKRRSVKDMLNPDYDDGELLPAPKMIHLASKRTHPPVIKEEVEIEKIDVKPDIGQKEALIERKAGGNAPGFGEKRSGSNDQSLSDAGGRKRPARNCERRSVKEMLDPDYDDETFSPATKRNNLAPKRSQPVVTMEEVKIEEIDVKPDMSQEEPSIGDVTVGKARGVMYKIAGSYDVQRKIANCLWALMEILNTTTSSLDTELLWCEHQLLRAVLDRVTRLQELKSPFKAYKRTKEDVEKFVKWCDKNGIYHDKVKLAEYLDLEEFGLKVTKRIDNEDIIMTVPKKLMLTAAMTGKCRNELRPSPVFLDVLNLYRKIVRHFSTLFTYLIPSELFQDSNKHKRVSVATSLFEKSPFTVSNLTFDLYRWAFCCVSSRKNLLPPDEGQKDKAHFKDGMPVLIPLLDIVNRSYHQDTDGDFSFRYIEEEARARITAGRIYGEDEIIPIIFGKRSNEDRLMHTGTVPVGKNPFDHYMIELILSNDDQHYLQKRRVINEHGFRETVRYNVYTFGLSAGEVPFHDRLIGFAQVLTSENPNEEALRQPGVLLRALQFLKEHFDTVSQMYNLHRGSNRIAVDRLHRGEMKLLAHAREYCALREKRLTDCTTTSQ